MWNFLKLCVELLFPCDELTIYVIKVIFTNNLIIINGEYNTMCLRITHTHTHTHTKKKKNYEDCQRRSWWGSWRPGSSPHHRPSAPCE